MTADNAEQAKEKSIRFSLLRYLMFPVVRL